ncbi:CPBP family intramembrane glutamic endopeptidase [Lysinibacillus sp. BW-2-10]|uniref:CPBP family intramembrane glutamic endopeptidase n=1 Tax=Lysinibacillus sp. BW-2-10 TaxID=2590030 RepID=UPI001180587B|nr:CPBP family intramembrane glutamic endopeptidase [Lysinibacillus sp. BW-2-10]TSI04756.1 CPBP family intramembrane metalloprotease [Lysinibacillus sp. BW-2-10]
MIKNSVNFGIKFLILSLYFNLLPNLFPMNDVIRFFHIILFFGIAYWLAKLSNANGLQSYGLIFFKGWKRNLTYGFVTGAFFWLLLFGAYLSLGKLEFVRIKSASESVLPIAIIIFGFGTGSLINDMITRGLVFYHFKDRLPIPVVFIISILLYAFDDIWYAGFSWQNTIFSIVLGLSLTYAFYKTNSIWANTGIHFGLNTIYGLFYGVSGNVGDGVLLFSENVAASWVNWLSTILSAIMLMVVLLTIKFYRTYER